MMKPMTKAITVALIQATLVGSLGAKLLYDRSTCPHAWFKAERYDPNLPIRGRYLNLQLEVKDPLAPEEAERDFRSPRRAKEGSSAAPVYPGPSLLGWECGSIDVSSGKPTAVFDQSSPSPPDGCDNLSFARRRIGDNTVLTLGKPVLFFIPDTAQDPTGLVSGEELWVLATVPRRGPPRPIALGLTRVGEIAIRPLNLN
jgi:hypothetical protein